MKNIHDEKTEIESTEPASGDQQSCEQLDLFEWAFLGDESCVGFAVREGL